MTVTNTGANGMKHGDRVRYKIDGRVGTAGEFMPDGDVDVNFDKGGWETVKWSNIEPENRNG